MCFLYISRLQAERYGGIAEAIGKIRTFAVPHIVQYLLRLQQLTLDVCIFRHDLIKCAATNCSTLRLDCNIMYTINDINGRGSRDSETSTRYRREEHCQ